MTDISVVILVGKEALHIKRCLEKLATLEPKQVFIVESQAGDDTHQIAVSTAKTLGWDVIPVDERQEVIDESRTAFYAVWHDWPGLYAPQMNWAFENLPITSNWIMRLDADEYYLPEAIEEIKSKLPSVAEDVTGIVNKRRHYIFGGWAKHGTYPVRLLRIFRRGKGFCEERYMDEHIELREGRAVEFDYDFVDHNLNSFEWWKEKHRGYAKREAMDAREIMEELRSGQYKKLTLEGQAAVKRAKKYKYYSLPPYFRAFAYFCIRYFLKGGFLDGYTGWMWNYWQGLWYRWLVDYEIGCLKRK